ncbi:hypothetical protein SYK_06770 [Pseudodesulfovibrio nedwellii]|uniref:DUF5675 domain-containing protein n=1 Tax=Pseudodesulfovibrio nedwellii TaxID=2973072 RepID=A0ABM8AXT4_9BACT|nr:DUF5675 family protein [Pseudodesulfovibrio nedwellii]BDQ35916.1 hypothetical protein SYK_02760 [Pseudodesulfovibrio nedwellii]BDQ36317.1 hypothetical protein SYK_06770 [Pseudodesulfovibrio nedwellii]
MSRVKRAMLHRYFMDESCTRGVLTLPWNGLTMYTLERPWLDNAQSVSCIPPGLYPLAPVYSNHFGNILAVQNVEGRSLIRVHSGNKVAHSKGCILVGQSAGFVKKVPFIFQSKAALRPLVKVITASGLCELEVVNGV